MVESYSLSPSPIGKIMPHQWLLIFSAKEIPCICILFYVITSLVHCLILLHKSCCVIICGHMLLSSVIGEMHNCDKCNAKFLQKYISQYINISEDEKCSQA